MKDSKDIKQIKSIIDNGLAVLGIELGSTRIKGVLLDNQCNTIASGNYDWENQLVDGIWTYCLDDVNIGIQECFSDLSANVNEMYGTNIRRLASIGFSGMMHGYLAFNKNEELLVPFRTWRNTMTAEASNVLTNLFDFQVPQRWSIAHLFQAMLNGEEHIGEIDYLTTLSGYVHWRLTGQKVLGVGDASGMFPIDSDSKDYSSVMLESFDNEASKYAQNWNTSQILPKVLVAGEEAGVLTEAGAKLLDPSGNLTAGIPLCPPEGDAGTGMVATNCVRKRTGNISAGTSVFAMIVLEKALSKVYPEIDMVTTPTGEQVAMVHSNNCTSDLNAWMMLFKEFGETFGVNLSMDQLYTTMFKKALEADGDGGGLLAYNYFSGEHITGFVEGRPLFVRKPESRFNLANFMNVHLYTSIGALKIGMDLLMKNEAVQVDNIHGHGGFFKTEVVGQTIMASALNTPVSVMDTAGEGGAWGIAVLASYMNCRIAKELSLEEFLDDYVFQNMTISTITPKVERVDGFNLFMESYRKGLIIEEAAIDNF